MTTPFDFHTHHLDATAALISVDPRRFNPEPGKWYSVGFHPWDTTGELGDADYALLEQCATHPQVLAIGETGLDSRRGAEMGVQRQVFVRHLTLAAALGKPVVVHSVKTAQEILAVRRTMGLTGVTLAIHGMRANERVARLLLDEGCYLSFGVRFNPRTLQETPIERLLIETDEDPTPIQEVAAAVADQLQISAEEVIRQTDFNARRLLKMP
jgi:TatD DNase family protein